MSEQSTAPNGRWVRSRYGPKTWAFAFHVTGELWPGPRFFVTPPRGDPADANFEADIEHLHLALIDAGDRADEAPTP